MHIATHRPVAKQWLRKQRPFLGNGRNIHVRNNRTRLCNPFLSNGFVNTQATIEELLGMILYRDGGTCWGITDSATQFSLSLFVSDLTVGITPLSSSNARTRELSNRRLSNPRTVDSRSLEVFSRNLTLEVSCNLVLSLTRSLCSLQTFQTGKTLELSGLR
jgi:hypothetical protein